jgi:hypothetical protein
MIRNPILAKMDPAPLKMVSMVCLGEIPQPIPTNKAAVSNTSMGCHFKRAQAMMMKAIELPIMKNK